MGFKLVYVARTCFHDVECRDAMMQYGFKHHDNIAVASPIDTMGSNGMLNYSAQFGHSQEKHHSDTCKPLAGLP